MQIKYYGKKLLLLGGSNNIEDLLSFQEKTGVIFAVTTDGNYKSNSLRNIAQETYDISPLDKEGLIKLINDKKLDGIFAGGNEDIISCAIGVAETCGLPIYASREQWELTSNKKRFKEVCRQYGIPTVKEYPLLLLNEQELNQLEYPVVLKPVDACGSRGVTLCNTPQEILEKYESVKNESRNGDVIAEEFMRGTEIVAYYTLCAGEISLSSVSDRYNRENLPGINQVPDAYQYPSKYTELFIQQYNDAIIHMIRHGLKLEDGVLGIQGFACNGELTFFEMGYRLGGTAQYRYTNAINGVNNFDMLLSYALSGHMDGYVAQLDNPRLSKPCCTLTMMVRPGTIDRLEGVEAVNAMDGVLYTEVHYKPGDTVQETNTMAQIIFWVFLIAEDEEKLKSLIQTVQKTLKAVDQNGQNMILSSFNPDRLDYQQSTGIGAYWR